MIIGFCVLVLGFCRLARSLGFALGSGTRFAWSGSGIVTNHYFVISVFYISFPSPRYPRFHSLQSLTRATNALALRRAWSQPEAYHAHLGNHPNKHDSGVKVSHCINAITWNGSTLTHLKPSARVSSPSHTHPQRH
jgi:hypothetical protein